MSVRRGFATLVVLWSIILVTAVVVGVQIQAASASASSRREEGRVRAYWAARAGLESQIATLAFNTVTPDTGAGLTVHAELAESASGTLERATYEVRHTMSTNGVPTEDLGAGDAHAKLNINTLTYFDLMLLPDMTEDVADSILDWLDPDDDARELGAESGTYQSLAVPYEPRNGPIGNLAELELVAGVNPFFLKGEDWNLNGVLDPEENDGDLSFPPDNADGVLDAGWSGYLTASSTGAVLGYSGEPRLILTETSSDELRTRLGLDVDQAERVLEYAQTDGATMSEYIRTPLTNLPTVAGFALNQPPPPIEPLSREQLAALLDECVMESSDGEPARAGKLNINTCDSETLGYLAAVEPVVADAIVLERESRSGGMTSIVELLSNPTITNDRLADLYPLLTATPTAFVATSIGRDTRTGARVELVAVIDRSTLPIVIRDLVVR